MSRLVRTGLVALIGLFILGSVSQAAIRRVPARLSMMEIYGGYSQPMGTVEGVMTNIDYGNIGITDKFLSNGRIVQIDAEDTYDPSFYVGFKLGSTFAERLLGKIGLQYSKFNVVDSIFFPLDSVLDLSSDSLSFHQVDVSFDVNAYLLNPLHAVVNPYVGIGLQAGVIGIKSWSSGTDYRGNIATSLNFGLDLKIATSASGRTFWVLASDNRWDFYASNDRPKQLQIGAAIRVFLRN